MSSFAVYYFRSKYNLFTYILLIQAHPEQDSIIYQDFNDISVVFELNSLFRIKKLPDNLIRIEEWLFKLIIWRVYRYLSSVSIGNLEKESSRLALRRFGKYVRL